MCADKESPLSEVSSFDEANIQLNSTLVAVKKLKDIKCDVPGLKGELEPHQRVGVSFLVLAKKALCLDFVGAGKTVQSIAAELKLRSIGEVRRTLICCLGSTRHHWARNYRQFSDISTYVIEGNKKNRMSLWMTSQGDVGATIANYESIRSDLPSMIKSGYRFLWDMIVFDEASFFKSYDTAIAAAIRLLVDHTNPSVVLGLTATPIQKKLEDLWCIMEKIRPGLLGANYYEFQDRHVIQRKIQARTPRGSFRTFWKTVGYCNEVEIAEKIQPFFIKRNRDDVYTDLKRRLEQERVIDLTDKQQQLYNSIKTEVRLGKRDAFISFQELEQTCDSMQFFDAADDTSAKIDDLMWLLENDLVDEKVVVFSKYKKTLYHLMGRLNKAGIKYVEFTGDIQDKDKREANRVRFQEDTSVRVMVATTAAEMGIELHAARYMVFLNLVYNPARIEQIKGRIDRPIVQKSPFVCYITYLAKDTHEERLFEQMKKEQELFNKVFGSNGTSISLSREQLYRLIVDGKIDAE